jgi:hypoxanthine phosphoribosyltransferase
MKLNLSFPTLKSLCIDLAERLAKEYKPDQIVAISRGGLVPATVIAKYLRLDVGFYMPKVDRLVLIGQPRRVAFVEDLVAQGRTFWKLAQHMEANFPYDPGSIPISWTYVPILVDGDFDKIDFQFYGLKTKQWVVMPWEEEEKMQVGDRGLFRERSDSYGKADDTVST